jgi:hypothetical protein
MTQPLIICSTEVDSYDKHCELLNAGYGLQEDGNFYVHKDMPNLHEMKEGKKLYPGFCGSWRHFCLKDLTALEYSEYLAKLLSDATSSKSIKLLSTVTHSIFNTRTAIYELARMIAPKNHNIAIHKSIDDDNQNDGVATSFTSTQMESNK